VVQAGALPRRWSVNQADRWVSVLDYIDYFKPRCMETLVNEMGYRTYPYKHYGSIFTRFYQGYILPTKFGIDKRKLHLSTLLMSGQTSREEALRIMERIPYPSDADLQGDIDYFTKKMGWTREQLTAYVARPQISHTVYGSEKPLWDALAKAARTSHLLARHVKISET
jgi:hypothetical protein